MKVGLLLAALGAAFLTSPVSAALAGEPAAQSKPVSAPGPVAAMIEAAARTGKAEQVSAVADAAKEVFPDYAAAIDALAAERIAALAPSEKTAEAAPAAPPAEEKKPDGWTGKLAASAVIATGNSENMAIGMALDTRKESGKIAHNLDAYIDYGKSNGVQNLKRWGAAYQLDYKFSDRAYAFGRLSYDEDHYSGFDYRLFAGGGAGYFLSKTDALTWKVEGGPGYQYSPIDDTRVTQKEIAVYASTEVDWVIREGLKFEQDFKTVWTSPTTTFVSMTSLTAALSDAISAGVGYEYRYETDPPFGKKKTDTLLRATVSLGF